MSLKHKVIINVKDENGEKTRVVEGKRKTVRSRMLDLLFGKIVNLLVITHDDLVETVEIKALGGFIDWFLGGLDGFLYALIILVVADYITGIMCAIVDKELSSEIGYRGIFKKVLIFIMVGVGHMIDTHLIGDGSALRTAVILFYCSNEGISMLENASQLGLPIPEKLKNVLAQLHNKGGNES